MEFWMQSLNVMVLHKRSEMEGQLELQLYNLCWNVLQLKPPILYSCSNIDKECPSLNSFIYWLWLLGIALLSRRGVLVLLLCSHSSRKSDFWPEWPPISKAISCSTLIWLVAIHSGTQNIENWVIIFQNNILEHCLTASGVYRWHGSWQNWSGLMNKTDLLSWQAWVIQVVVDQEHWAQETFQSVVRQP